MLFRQAVTGDIQGMQVVRNSVKENVLSNPALVPDNDVEFYINQRGKGWVCEVDGSIVGFSIADLEDDNIWALFVLPQYEGKGIGKQLQHLMLQWYFDQGKKEVWLSTQPKSRAEFFYRNSGWNDAGFTKKGEAKFTLNVEDWKQSTPL